MPWPYLGEKGTERCPCCRREIEVEAWMQFLIAQVFELLWDCQHNGKPPPPVLCVDERGKPVRYGVAVTWRHHTGVIDVGILPRAGDWKHGWWWPLGRVLWEVKEEAG